MKHDVIGANIWQGRINKRIRTYLTLQNRDPKLIESFKAGHCSAYITLATYAEYLSTIKPRKNKPRDDWNWLINTLTLLSNWNLSLDSLSKQDEEDIERLICHLDYFQCSRKKLLKNTDDSIIDDTRDRMLTLEHHLAGTFSAAHLTHQLNIDDQSTTILNEMLKYNKRVIRISCNKHVVGVFKDQHHIYLHDANFPFGRKIYDLHEKESLAKDILKTLSIEKNTLSLLNIRIFTFGKSKEHKYIPKEKLLPAIREIQIKEINSAMASQTGLFSARRPRHSSRITHSPSLPYR